MNRRSQCLYEFGQFRLDTAERLLLCEGTPLALEPKVFDTLLLLVENRGHLVEKDDFMKKLWPDTFVGEDTLAHNISVLRKMLGQAADGQEYIATVPKRGYRFVASVREGAGGSGDTGVQKAAEASLVTGDEERGARNAAASQKVARDAVLVLEGPGPGTAVAGFRLGRIGILAAAGSVGLLAGFLTFLLLSPPAVPKAVRVTQITNTGSVEPWARLVSDGARIFFMEREGNHWNLVQMSVAGGEAQPVLAPSQNTRIMDLSPDQSEFLVASFVVRDTEMPLWITPVVGGWRRRVGEITATDAIWYPDGKTILYVKGSELYLVERDGTNARKFVGTGGLPSWLAWSPDKRKLRFTVWEPDGSSSSLWEVAGDGTGLRPLLPDWSNPPTECCGRWTPDGSYFLFTSHRGGTANIWALRETRTFFRRRPREPMQVTTGPTEFWGGVPSKDGKRLLLFGMRPQREMVQYDVKSEQFSPYLPGTRAGSVSFLRSGDWIAYIVSPEDTLWRSRPDGSSRQQLTFPPEKAHDAHWSPDGKQIAFWTTITGGPSKVYLISAGGGSPREVASEWRNSKRPDWSPNGESLVFEVSVGSSASLSSAEALYMINLKTNEVSKLAGSEGFLDPRWSPEGRYIAALSNNQSKLMLFDMHTQQWTQLAQGTLLTSLVWSRDGRALHFQDLAEAEQPVYRLGTSDHKRERVTGCEKLLRAGVFRCALVELAADGSPLLQLTRSWADIYALDLDLP